MFYQAFKLSISRFKYSFSDSYFIHCSLVFSCSFSFSFNCFFRRSFSFCAYETTKLLFEFDSFNTFAGDSPPYAERRNKNQHVIAVIYLNSFANTFRYNFQYCPSHCQFDLQCQYFSSSYHLRQMSHGFVVESFPRHILLFEALLSRLRELLPESKEIVFLIIYICNREPHKLVVYPRNVLSS